ncbi:hypothetical protein [Pseudochrobactrum sp. HB0163]|uniref:hypothetical protein n=1 Tax=Pseudochrobactrum sp. HB0163 TaxID=3450708 RepID=UPI003F6DD817
MGEHGGARFHIRDLLPALALLFVLLGGLVVAALRPVGKDDQYIVMVAPWRTLNSVISAIQGAEGTIVAVDSSSSLITVYSPQKDFLARLYQAGVWLVFEPLQTEGCFAIQKRTTGI